MAYTVSNVKRRLVFFLYGKYNTYNPYKQYARWVAEKGTVRIENGQKEIFKNSKISKIKKYAL